MFLLDFRMSCDGGGGCGGGETRRAPWVSSVVLTARQAAAVAWMARREGQCSGSGEGEAEEYMPYGGILADDVGAGKTHVVGRLLHVHALWPTLIVVPKSLLYQWVGELRDAGHAGVVVVASRSAAERRGGAPGLRRGDDVVLASLSCFASALGAPALLGGRAWGRVVVDEAHLIKNPRTRSHRALACVRAHARWALTATPVQNCRADLLALARFVGVRGDDAELVRERFMLRRGNEGGAAGEACASGACEACEACEAGEAGEAPLPPLTVLNVVLPLVHRWEADVCREVHADPCARLAASEAAAATGSMSAGAMERVLRCRQVATHLALYYGSLSGGGGAGRGDADAEAALEHARLAERARSLPASEVSTKVGWLVADVLAHARSKCVVFCEWRDEMRLVAAALEAAGVRCGAFHGELTIEERDETLDAFRKRSGFRALVAQVRCASVGLNIQCASRVYLMRPQWNPAVEKQAIGRVHRRGQRRPVVAMRLVAQGTIDECCLRRQAQKLACITEVLHDDSMQRTLQGAPHDTDSCKQLTPPARARDAPGGPDPQAQAQPPPSPQPSSAGRAQSSHAPSPPAATPGA